MATFLTVREKWTIIFTWIIPKVIPMHAAQSNQRERESRERGSLTLLRCVQAVSTCGAWGRTRLTAGAWVQLQRLPTVTWRPRSETFPCNGACKYVNSLFEPCSHSYTLNLGVPQINMEIVCLVLLIFKLNLNMCCLCCEIMIIWLKISPPFHSIRL